ncbi:MAG: hypothetical protein ACP5T0_12745 [Verrucomicrobiia bacterium]
MMPRDVAEAVVASLEEDNPRWLAELASKDELWKIIKERADRYYSEVFHLIKLRGEGEKIYIMEACMPILTEFQKREGKALNSKEKSLVKKQIKKFLIEFYKENKEE